MKTRKILSLTRSRQISALCWAVILAAGLCARQFPVRELLPLPLRVLAAALLVVTAAAVITTSLGLFTERGDERSARNEHRTDAALFTLFFLALGAALLFAGEGWSVTLGRGEILTLFAAVCLARDMLFLGYERFAP